MRNLLLAGVASIAILAGSGTLAEPSGSIRLEVAGTYSTGVYDEGAAEIPAYSALTKRLFVVNGAAETIDVLDVRDPANPKASDDVAPIALAAFGSPNSVAVFGRLVAAPSKRRW